MADDKMKRGPQERGNVNLSEDYEVQYWSTKFHVQGKAGRVPSCCPAVENINLLIGHGLQVICGVAREEA